MKNAIVAPLRWKYFRDTRSLSKERILVSDYENMGGRVARYGFVSDFGRAVFVTASYVDHKFFTDHYVNGRLEEMTPALNRREMDRPHPEPRRLGDLPRRRGDQDLHEEHLTGRTLWNTEMTDADYDKVIERRPSPFPSNGGLTRRQPQRPAHPQAPLGKNTAAKGDRPGDRRLLPRIPQQRRSPQCLRLRNPHAPGHVS
jgi:hypothetical protein